MSATMPDSARKIPKCLSDGRMNGHVRRNVLRTQRKLSFSDNSVACAVLGEGVIDAALATLPRGRPYDSIKQFNTLRICSTKSAPTAASAVSGAQTAGPRTRPGVLNLTPVDRR